MNSNLYQDNLSVQKGVVIPDNVYQSWQGNYYFGQTDLICYNEGYHAWGGLFNPINSKVTMYLNAYTITNFSYQPITAEGWLSSELPGNPVISPLVAAGNQALYSSKMPRVRIESASNVAQMPTGGTYTFVRRVEPNNTLTKHDFQGLYIIPPDSSFVLFFVSQNQTPICTRVAFGWWEEAN